MPDPLLITARELLDSSVSEMRSALDGASPEILNRRPGGDATNSLAILAVHSLHSTRAWLSGAVAAPAPPRNRDEEFVATTANSSSLVAFVDAMRQDCARLLDGADNIDWNATRGSPPRPNTGDEPQYSAAFALLHALQHLREHVGQMTLTRQLVDASWAAPAN